MVSVWRPQKSVDLIIADAAGAHPHRKGEGGTASVRRRFSGRRTSVVSDGSIPNPAPDAPEPDASQRSRSGRCRSNAHVLRTCWTRPIHHAGDTPLNSRHHEIRDQAPRPDRPVSSREARQPDSGIRRRIARWPSGALPDEPMRRRLEPNEARRRVQVLDGQTFGADCSARTSTATTQRRQSDRWRSPLRRPTPLRVTLTGNGLTPIVVGRPVQGADAQPTARPASMTEGAAERHGWPGNAYTLTATFSNPPARTASLAGTDFGCGATAP